MADEHERSVEGEVSGAISSLEQILAAMPDDRSALEGLSRAYEQVGDGEKAADCLVRLANVLLNSGDAQGARLTLGRLEAYAGESQAAADVAGRIREQSQAPQEADAVEAPQAAAVAGGAGDLEGRFNMADELSFAWSLLGADQITQEEYSSVVQDLTEMYSGGNVATVSLLHALEARGFKRLEKIIGYASRECEMPIVSLSGIEMKREAVSVLPIELMMRRGVLTFGFVGNDVLAVVMNPYDSSLKAAVESMTGRTCHFFVTLPSDFDQALARVPDILAKEETED